MDEGIERVSGETVSFGSFRLHRSERYIEKSGIPVPLGARALDILLALVDQAGAVVSKKALLQQAWRDTTVNEGSLRVQINILRKVLGDDR
jgi:DNA-binding winged helix-turn-helix (wHTH) protein